MDPLLIVKKCKPHGKFTLKNPFPSRSMIIFAEDAIYVVKMNRDLIATFAWGIGSAAGEAGEMVGDFIGAKLGDWRSTRSENSEYQKLAEDIEQYVSEQKKSHRFEYSDLQRFVYRKNMPLVVGVGEYIGFRFSDESFYFDVGDKHVIDPILAILKDLAPQADLKKKTGPMVTRS